MKSSKPLYSILGLYIPVSVFILWAPLPGMVYRFFTADYSAPLPFDTRLWCLACFLTALAASCYAGVMKKNLFTHSGADLRGAITAAAGVYALLSLLRRGIPLPQRFYPSVNSAAAALTAFFTWFSVISLRGIFNGMELFESVTGGHQGEQLRGLMREYAPEMSVTGRRLKNLMRGYGIQFILPCLMTGAAGFSRTLSAVFTLAAFSAGFLLLGFLGLLRRELACASEGTGLTAGDRSRPLPVMALGIGAAALLASAGSSDSSLLPPGLIAAFLGWAAKLISGLFKPVDPADFKNPDRELMPLQESFAPLLPRIEHSGPWPGWAVVKIAVIALAASLFLIFMIYPLLKRSGFSFTAGAIRAAVARWFRELKEGAAAFFGAFRDMGSPLARKKADQGKLRRIGEGLLAGARRKEAGRSVSLFARLILWGIESAGVPWKPSLAPGEYCGLLASAPALNRAPGGSSDIKGPARAVIRCGGLFEKALYSPDPLTAGEEEEFKQLVRGITGGWLE